MELRNYILSKVNPKQFYKEALGEGYGGNVICPFHEDSNPSLNIKDDGSAYCFGCKKKWKNIIDFYMEYKKLTFSRAIYNLYSKYISPIIPRGIYIKMYINLTKNTKARRWLINRGIGNKTINKFLMGYDERTKRISLPIFDEWGYCVNLRLFRYKKNNEPKVISFKKGMGKCRLFPMINLFHKEIYLFEGEMDALLGIHLGLNAMSMTGGAGAWRREFTRLFKDKIVYICFDNDASGQAGAKRVAKELHSIAETVYNIIIPKKFGKDFTDYMKHRPIEAFLNIVTATREVTPKDTRDIAKLRDFEEYSQEESMIVEMQPKKQLLHIIVKLSPER